MAFSLGAAMDLSRLSELIVSTNVQYLLISPFVHLSRMAARPSSPETLAIFSSFRGPRADWAKAKEIQPSVSVNHACRRLGIFVWFYRLGIGLTDAQAGLVRYGTFVDVYS